MSNLRNSSSFLLVLLTAGCATAVAPSTSLCNGDLGVDLDGDGIATVWEGTSDPDHDGYPSYLDDDSDGDGFSDEEEAGEGGDCETPPRDTDGDHIFDFLDVDANGDGVPDELQALTDRDEDGVLDYLDLDTDGDGVPNLDELMEGDTDVDGDGLPDSVDADSDGDTIEDGDETGLDSDGDGVPNRRDLDSDDDGIPDRVEAGDDDPSTPPFECPDEIDIISERFATDGRPDFRDRDSDGDGLPDDDEVASGTSVCGSDTDGDLWIDLYEVVYERTTCVAGDGGEPECGCALEPECVPPREDIFVVLPYGAPALERDAIFDATIRQADVFFLGTPGGGFFGDDDSRVLTDSFTRSVGNLATTIRQIIPGAWFGSGISYDIERGGWYSLAVTLPITDGADIPAIASHFDIADSGADFFVPQPTEAIGQLLGSESATCPAGRWGRGCFREDAIPFVVHVEENACPYNGPPGDACPDIPLDIVFPPLHGWAEMVDELRTADAVYVGLRARGSFEQGAAEFGYVSGRWGGTIECDTSPTPDTVDPACGYLAETARATGSVDREGNPNAFSFQMSPLADVRLPDGTHPPHGDNLIVAALERALYTKRLHVDTALRDDPSDLEGVDATGFIKSIVPACLARHPAESCWVARDPVPQDEAVAAVDETTFYATYGGTRVRYRLELVNDFVPQTERVMVFVALIDARGDGRTLLDTRRLFAIVPAAELF